MFHTVSAAAKKIVDETNNWVNYCPMTTNSTSFDRIRRPREPSRIIDAYESHCVRSTRSTKASLIFQYRSVSVAHTRFPWHTSKTNLRVVIAERPTFETSSLQPLKNIRHDWRGDTWRRLTEEWSTMVIKKDASLEEKAGGKWKCWTLDPSVEHFENFLEFFRGRGYAELCKFRLYACVLFL